MTINLSYELYLYNQCVLIECIRFQVRINRNIEIALVKMLTDLVEGFRVANEFSAS